MYISLKVKLFTAVIAAKTSDLILQNQVRMVPTYQLNLPEKLSKLTPLKYLLIFSPLNSRAICFLVTNIINNYSMSARWI